MTVDVLGTPRTPARSMLLQDVLQRVDSQVPQADPQVEAYRVDRQTHFASHGASTSRDDPQRGLAMLAANTAMHSKINATDVGSAPLPAERRAQVSEVLEFLRAG